MILSPMWSAVTKAYTNQDYYWLKNSLRKLTYISLLFCSLVILMFLFNKHLLFLWLGNKVDFNQHLVLLMAFHSILVLLTSPFSIFVNGFGKIVLTTRISYFSLPLFFTLVFSLNTYFNSSVFVVLSIILAVIPGYFAQFLQVNKILNKKASGIWNR